MLHLTILDANAVPPPPPPVPGSPVQTWREHDGTVIAYGYAVNGEHWMHWPNLASFCLTGNPLTGNTDAVVALAQPPSRTDTITDTFRRSVLPMALQLRGQEVLHSSAVQFPHGVVALCAVSETGKSTLACALSQRGYRLWADDAVALDITEREVRSVPLPFRLRLRPRSAAYFAHNQGNTVGTTQAAKHDHGKPVPLAAICILEQRTPDTFDAIVDVQQLAPAEAFREVLAHAYCFSLDDMARKRAMMQHYLLLAQRVPIFTARFQTGLQHVDAIVDGIVRAVDQIADQVHQPT